MHWHIFKVHFLKYYSKFIGGDHISKLGIGGSLGEARTEFFFFAKFCIVVIFVLREKGIFLYKNSISKIIKKEAILGQVCHTFILGCNR